MSAQAPLRWDEALVACRGRPEACVLATVLGTSGSAPRDPGSKMVVTATTTHDSIGGGRLELLVIEAARTLLRGDGPDSALRHFPLGQEARQCCGGAVSVLLERIAPALTPLALFGAGHVGQALVRILAELPFHVIWVDPRAERLPEAPPVNVRTRAAADPLTTLDELPADTPAVVMTHDHDLDYHLVAGLLRRSTHAFVGLIASEVKAARFRMRLRADGLDTDALARLTSPVGLPAVTGKEPMAVAVAVAGQLLAKVRTDGAREREPGRQQGLRWDALRTLAQESEG